MNRLSLLAFWIGAATILGTAFFFFPKWKQGRDEATLSYDVAGYYLYLPAALIYRDVREFSFGSAVLEKYRFASELAAYPHPSGGRVIKYSIGQALQFLPWFAVGHLAAKALGYPADGFSLPYQVAISMGSLLVALLGLWVLRKILLRFFTDGATASALLLVVLGTNYLDYSAINGAMTHNWLFTLYTLLLFATIRFYERPTWAAAAAIGLLIGWAALTRPTDIIAATVPMIWGIYRWGQLPERFRLWQLHLPKLGLAVGIAGLVLFIQMAYWKYATGEWLVYTYGDQGFSWLKPHLMEGMFSYKSGWLTYSPMLVFALIGFVPLFRRHRTLFWTAFIMGMLYIYITFAWDIWWYGGSLGQRAMVQSYPFFALPLTALAEWVYRQKRTVSFAFWGVAGLFIWYNLWLTRHAHLDGLLRVGEMNRAYFWKILGKSRVPEEAELLLDSAEDFQGEPQNLRQLFYTDFEQDSMRCAEPPIAGRVSLCLDATHQFSPDYSIPPQVDGGWLRVSATVRCINKEWEIWRMPQMILKYRNGDQVVKENMIRPHRILDKGETQTVSLISRIPAVPFNKVEVLIWNAESPQTMLVDNLKVETFQ